MPQFTVSLSPVWQLCRCGLHATFISAEWHQTIWESVIVHVVCQYALQLPTNQLLITMCLQHCWHCFCCTRYNNQTDYASVCGNESHFIVSVIELRGDGAVVLVLHIGKDQVWHWHSDFIHVDWAGAVVTLRVNFVMSVTCTRLMLIVCMLCIVWCKYLCSWMLFRHHTLCATSLPIAVLYMYD